MKKKRGRPPITDTMPLEKIMAAYKKFGSIASVCRALSLSPKTVRKYLKHAGISTKEPLYFFKPDTSMHFGCIPEWIRNHPETRLPTSIKEVARITGCSYESARTYMYRFRKRIKEIAAEIVQCMHQVTNLILIDINGYKITPRGAKGIVIDHERYSFEANMLLVYQEEEHIVHLSDMRETLRKIKHGGASS